MCLFVQWKALDFSCWLLKIKTVLEKEVCTPSTYFRSSWFPQPLSSPHVGRSKVLVCLTYLQPAPVTPVSHQFSVCSSFSFSKGSTPLIKINHGGFDGFSLCIPRFCSCSWTDSHFNTGLNPEDVPTFPKILPDAVSKTACGHSVLIWSRLGQERVSWESHVFPVSRVLEKDVVRLPLPSVDCY